MIVDQWHIVNRILLFINILDKSNAETTNYSIEDVYMAKKKDVNLVNGGGSFGEKAVLRTQGVIEGVIEKEFPKLAFTVDGQTEKMMDVLREPTHLSRGAIARVIIKDVMDSPERFPIAVFYADTWRHVVPGTNKKSAMHLLLPREFNLYLREMSANVLGTENRSEMFRFLVALYADAKGKLRRTRREVIELDAEDPASGKPSD